jgi:hypothetical protein
MEGNHVTTLEYRYLAKMNRRTGQHDLHRPDMAFIPAPKGATGRGMLGYDVTEPHDLMGVYSQVAQVVAGEFGFSI